VQAVRRSKLLVVAVAVALLGAAQLLSGFAAAAPNPPGNNGTIKVDDVPFDDAPNNEPHVGCTFQVDFYGFDEGDLNADVLFESHPPTGPVVTLLEDTVFIGEDDNSGGGSEAGLDASETYTLDFTGIEPHPNQGFHVKLTINADGSQGADVKHKVFWVTGCPPVTTTTSGSRPLTAMARPAPRARHARSTMPRASPSPPAAATSSRPCSPARAPTATQSHRPAPLASATREACGAALVGLAELVDGSADPNACVPAPGRRGAGRHRPWPRPRSDARRRADTRRGRSRRRAAGSRRAPPRRRRGTR